MSDRIVVMNAGRVEQDGTPEDLYHRPRSRFVAEFIGETNIIEGVVRGTGADGVVIDWHGTTVHGAAHGDAPPAAGEAVAASLRLEHIVCHPAPPATGDAVEGRIVNRLFKGSRTTVDIAVGDNLVRAYLDPADAGRIADDRVWITWDRDRLAVIAA